MLPVPKSAPPPSMILSNCGNKPFGLTFFLGLFLVYHAGWIILLVGVLSILSGYAYTTGPLPLAYNGLGDIFVFIFFGIVATVGTYYVQSLHFSYFALFASIPVGLLITNILVVNNYRDADEDKTKNKNTLAVIFGKVFSLIQYSVSIVVSYAVPVFVFFYFDKSIFVLLPYLSMPLAVKLIYELHTIEGEKLNDTLASTAKLSIIFSFLFAIGIVI